MTTTQDHPEMQQEQVYVDAAYQWLDRGMADAERSMAEHKTLHRNTAEAIRKALRILQDSRGAGQLVFGKMVDADETLYIGRRRVHNEDRDPVVIGWHAPAAQRFYEASPQDPAGLRLKRVFTEQDRTLVRVIDEIVASSAAAAADPIGTGVAFSDALLAELDRSRDGAMRDVVSTIQSEQFAIIRAPITPAVVVQGGPGTGKTVVGLHRAAWLAFNHEELRRSGILVVAPSTGFLTYVSGVLPSLDVTDVDQIEVQRLYSGEAETNSIGDPISERVKGSAAMAQVLARARESRIGWGEEDLTFRLGGDQTTLLASDVRAMVESIRTKDQSHVDGRDEVRDRLARMVLEQHRDEQRSAGRPVGVTEGVIRRLGAFANALDRMWPTFTPESLLRTLYGTQSLLATACAGLLSVDERASLFRAPAASLGDELWTAADVHCLDELSYLISREVVTYGHVVVDEAQDLSPMQARSLARRCPTGSFTLLGDLAQGTGPWIREDWADLTQHMGCAGAQRHDLTIGYRVPAPVLELAARQLPLAGVALEAPRSIRSGWGEPQFHRVGPDELEETVVTALTRARERDQQTAVLVAGPDHSDWLDRLGFHGVDVGDGAAGEFGSSVTVLPATHAKGLEFDHVLMVEPTKITGELAFPERALYVAMTRCTQSLEIVHSMPLPPGMGEEGPFLDLPVSGAMSQGDPSTTEQHGDLELLTQQIAALNDEDLELVQRLVERLSRGTEGEE